jgi:hypothetical protein
MADVIRASEIGPELAYHLGTNPSEASRIAKMSPYLQAKEIGRLEGKLLSEPPARKTSSAPAPITPVRPKGSPPVIDTTDPRAAEQLSVSEWIAKENERERKRYEARFH